MYLMRDRMAVPMRTAHQRLSSKKTLWNPSSSAGTTIVSTCSTVVPRARSVALIGRPPQNGSRHSTGRDPPCQTVAMWRQVLEGIEHVRSSGPAVAYTFVWQMVADLT